LTRKWTGGKKKPSYFWVNLWKTKEEGRCHRLGFSRSNPGRTKVGIRKKTNLNSWKKKGPCWKKKVTMKEINQKTKRRQDPTVWFGKKKKCGGGGKAVQPNFKGAEKSATGKGKRKENAISTGPNGCVKKVTRELRVGEWGRGGQNEVAIPKDPRGG